MDSRSRTGGRPTPTEQIQTLAVFATGILAEAMYVIGLGALCSVAIMAVLLAGG
ncbi:MAG: hypothetical protein JW733_04290 [Coriobacteriia bacterium]|nr:hypothetical protein [Coriobacteriia bacterium]MBN2839821.1 hypothetical protein [Coriobacteriia bacterium]